MPKIDLLDREDVRDAVRNGRLGALSGAARAALRARGVLASRVVWQDGRTEWWLTDPVGVRLQAQFRAEAKARLEAERAARGTVTVPRWAAERAAADQWLPADVRAALAGALEVPHAD